MPAPTTLSELIALYLARCRLRPGVRLQPNGLKQLLRRRGRAAHVPRCHAHRFRHTFATWAIQQDARELDVQHLLGHAGGVPCLIVELRLEEPQARARIAGREHDPLRTSDATEDVHAAQRERFEPVTDAEGASLVLDASRSPGALARDIAEALAGVGCLTRRRCGGSLRPTTEAAGGALTG